MLLLALGLCSDFTFGFLAIAEVDTNYFCDTRYRFPRVPFRKDQGFVQRLILLAIRG